MEDELRDAESMPTRSTSPEIKPEPVDLDEGGESAAALEHLLPHGYTREQYDELTGVLSHLIITVVYN